MKITHLLSALTLLLATSPLFAGVTHVLHENAFGDCKITISHDAVEGHSGAIIFRSMTDSHASCPLPEEQVSTNLDQALKAFKARKDLAKISSIFLSGKLRTFNWMSTQLVQKASTSKAWDKDAGKPLTGSPNKYVNATLYSGALLMPFSAPLKKHNYDITGVSCEKILINEDGLPYEGMCWLQIIRND